MWTGSCGDHESLSNYWCELARHRSALHDKFWKTRVMSCNRKKSREVTKTPPIHSTNAISKSCMNRTAPVSLPDSCRHLFRCVVQKYKNARQNGKLSCTRKYDFSGEIRFQTIFSMIILKVSVMKKIWICDLDFEIEPIFERMWFSTFLNCRAIVVQNRTVDLLRHKIRHHILKVRAA